MSSCTDSKGLGATIRLPRARSAEQGESGEEFRDERAYHENVPELVAV